MSEPSEEELRNAPVVPGFELPDVFPLSRGALHTVGLQPEDHSVLAFLKMRDPRRPASKEDLAAEMRAIGWKMGKTRFDGIFGRLKSAGHIKHVSAYNAETGRPEWKIEFFANPSYNDHYVNSVISASSQVSCETPETSISPGQKESQVSRDTEGKPRNPAFPSGPVPAGQNRNAENPVFGSHPPHPPEEVETSSPYPLETSTPGREEGASFASNNEDQIQAAYEFLQDLPNPWRAGRATARKLAPKLAEAASEQGWSLDADLVKKLTEMPEGIKSYPSVLARRVDDLPRRGPSRVPGAQRDRYSDVPERPDQVVPSEEGMASVRAALAAFRGAPGAK